MAYCRRTFLEQLGLGAAGLGLAGGWKECLAAGDGPGGKLPRSTPEEQGMSSGAVLAFLEGIGHGPHEFHSFMLVRHGHVVAEGWWAPYGPNLRHTLYSLSKSFTSTAVGFAVAEGRLKVEDRVASYFPEDLPAAPSENLAALRVRDLLTMSVGHAEDSTSAITKSGNWVRTFLSLPIKNRPGSAFLYNSGATYMLSAVVQKVTGQKVIDYLEPRLFRPLDISGITWETCPRGINTGGWGLSIQTEGLAKFGQLYLQKGVWKGIQLLPASWIEEATTFKIQQPPGNGADLETLKKTSDWHQGYCYQFWRCRHNAFRGDGAFGQFTVVMPEQDAVLAITSETSNMQGELDLVWEHLLPAMRAEALPADRPTQGRLREKLDSLALAPPKARATCPMAAAVSGRHFKMEANAMGVEDVTFDFRADACLFSLRDQKGEYRIECGIEKWVEGETTMPGTPPKLTSGELGPKSKVAASGTWRDENTFEMTWHFQETPHHDTVTCHFEGNKVRVEFMNSVTRLSPSHKEARPVMEGTRS
jgi:CubicO group peptidase (beta-lactamase class C family)